MRLLQVIETGGPGGAETIFASLSSGLIDRGHTVTCVTAPGSWLPQELAARGIASSVMRTRGTLDTALLSRLRAIIHEQRIEVVHAHLFDGALYAALAARLEGIPCVATLHGQTDVARSGVKAWIKRALFSRSVSCVIAVSDALRRDLQASLSVPGARFRTIANGVDRAPTQMPEMRRADSSSAPRIVAIGNIRQPKDYPTLLDALALVCASYPAIHLDVAGEPDGEGLYEQLVAQVARLGLQERVTFHGFVADPAPLLARADCFVLSSSREGFSLATIEAMMAGVPVVATRSGGPEEILRDGDTGLLVPVGNAAALATAIVRLLRDPILAQQYRQRAAADAANRFTRSAMVDAYERLYQELLRAR